MVHDLRALLRLAKGKKEQPSAAIFDGRTMQSTTPESGDRAGYDGYKRKKGSKVHIAVDTKNKAPPVFLPTPDGGWKMSNSNRQITHESLLAYLQQYQLI